MAVQPVILFVNGQRREYTPQDNPNRFKLEDNRQVPKTVLDHMSDYAKTADGIFEFFQFLDRITRIVALAFKGIQSTFATTLETISDKLATAWQLMAIPRLFNVAPKMIKSWDNWFKAPQGTDAAKNRDRLQKVHDIADGAATCGLVTSLFTASNAIKNITEMPSLVSNITDLVMAQEDWTLAKRHLEALDIQNGQNEAVRDRFLYTIREAFLRMVKSVSSVASGILGILVLSFGAPVLPAFVLVSIGLIATISSMSAYFYKETRAQSTVDFFKIRQPELLARG